MSCVELKYRHQCTHCRGSCNTILFHWHIWSRVSQVYREADQRRYRCKKSILKEILVIQYTQSDILEFILIFSFIV